MTNQQKKLTQPKGEVWRDKFGNVIRIPYPGAMPVRVNLDPPYERPKDVMTIEEAMEAAGLGSHLQDEDDWLSDEKSGV